MNDEPQGLLTGGQIAAALLMLPLVFMWLADQWGIDWLAMIGLLPS